jgi:hypothetical protein
MVYQMRVCQVVEITARPLSYSKIAFSVYSFNDEGCSSKAETGIIVEWKAKSSVFH